MSSNLRAARLSRGISVNDLAARLSVTPSAVSQLERSELDGTIKLASLRTALDALGVSLRLTTISRSPMSEYTPHAVASAMADSLFRSSDPSHPLRLLSHAVAELNAHNEFLDNDDFLSAPSPLPDRRWDTLLRAVYARAIPGARRPSWTATAKLRDPWFVSNFPALQDRARTTTPAYLSALNIFIDQRSLESL